MRGIYNGKTFNFTILQVNTLCCGSLHNVTNAVNAHSIMFTNHCA